MSEAQDPKPASDAPVDAPVFVVVGHPNKGKSSLVATLSADDSIAIAAESGTTTKARRFPMRVDGETLYTLVDTPGFQRARRALQWMRDQETTADKHAEVVRQFVENHRGDETFVNEVELLGPIVGAEAGGTRPGAGASAGDPGQLPGAGATSGGGAVLYVVDGSVPYGPEYEPEMEVLRWTGRPSMAIVNPIRSAQHVEAWRAALSQYFRVVRVLDAVKAPLPQRLELLRAFGQLDEHWRGPMDRAVSVLEADRERRRARSAGVIAELLVSAVLYRETKKLGPEDDPEPHKPALEKAYYGRLRQMERRARDDVQDIYAHHAIRREEGELPLLEQDLFAKEAWLVFGLRKRDLVAASAAGGAMAGGALDVAVGGASFFAGAGIGAVIGGVLGWISADKLAEVKVVNLPLGGQLLRCGPTKSANFPFVLLGRARYHHMLVAERSHAQRGELRVSDESDGQGGGLTPLTDPQKKELAGALKRARSSADRPEARAQAAARIRAVVGAVLSADAGGVTALRALVCGRHRVQ